MGPRFVSVEDAAKLLQQNSGISHRECRSLFEAIVKRGDVLVRYGDNGKSHYLHEHDGARPSGPDKVHLSFDVHSIGTSKYMETIRQSNIENWRTSRSDQMFSDPKYQFDLEPMWSAAANLLNTVGCSISTTPPQRAGCKTQKRSSGGRPTKWDWEGATKEMVRIADLDRLPEKQAHMVECLMEWFSNNNEDGNQPDESQVKKHVSKLWPRQSLTS